MQLYVKMPRTHILEEELRDVLIEVAKICNKKVKKSYDKPYAIPRIVARNLGYFTTDGRADGNRAKTIMRKLAKQGKLLCIGTAKLRSIEGGKSATKYAEAYIINKNYE